MQRITPVIVLLAACTGAFGQSPVKINELYYSGSFSGNQLQANDAFVELYNPSSQTAYLDGMLLVALSSGATASAGAVKSTGMQAYKFPGAPGGHQHPIAASSYVVLARSAQDFTAQKGLNLSGADWEFFAGLPIVDADNAAPNLSPVGASFFAFDFFMSAANGAVLLCDGSDTTITDGISIASIVDAVEYQKSAPATKFLPAQIDLGWAGAGVAAGIAIERKTPGYDTGNSTVDFDSAAPSPGRAHGDGPLPTALSPNIYPLALWNYMDYDEYGVDTLGARIDSTRHRFSTWIKDTTALVGGQLGSVRIDSTIPLRVAATATKNYVRNPSGVEVQEFVDGAFLSSFLGAVGNVITTTPQWIAVYTGRAGFKGAYPIYTLDTSITFNGISLNVKVDMTGKWDGLDTVTVPAGTFPGYVFKITIHTTASAAGLVTLFDNTSIQTVWLSRGVGMVKFYRPGVSSGQGTTQQGIDRELRRVGSIVSVGSAPSAPAAVSLDPAYPNPFSGATRVSFTLPTAQHAALRLYDMSGACVRTIHDGACAAGTTTQTIDVANLAAGTYILRLETREQSAIRFLEVTP